MPTNTPTTLKQSSDGDAQPMNKDEPHECDACNALPDDYPCAECYIESDAEWPDGDAA